MVHQPWKDKPEPNQNKPGNLFNGMVNPHIPYGIRGAIWYQGERNSRNITFAKAYSIQLPMMINDWRRRWGQGDFPFLWAQLPNFKAVNPDPNATAFGRTRAKAWPRPSRCQHGHGHHHRYRRGQRHSSQEQTGRRSAAGQLGVG